MEHLAVAILNDIKKHEHPVAIYGAGGLAMKIADWVLKAGGVIDAFVIDARYVTSYVESIMDIPIRPLDKFVQGNDGADIIVGFEGDYKKNISEDMKDHIHRIYAADFLGYLALEGGNYISEEYYDANKVWFSELSEKLEDDKSRKALADFIEQKRTGVYEKDFDEPDMQYFDSEIIGARLTSDECFVDCGAFRGETTKGFVNFLKSREIDSYRHIYSFEPDHVNAFSMKEKLISLKNVDVIEAGVYKKTGRISFDANLGSSSRISEEGGNSIDAVALDDYLLDKEPVTFIKMDIEGSELDALHGSEKLLRKYKPKLAICIYHKKEDLVDIPKYLIGLGLGYRFYVRSYSRMGVETVLYAV